MASRSLTQNTNDERNGSALQELVSGNDRAPQECSWKIREMLESDRDGVHAEAVRVLGRSQESHGLRCLVTMLLIAWRPT